MEPKAPLQPVLPFIEIFKGKKSVFENKSSTLKKTLCSLYTARLCSLHAPL